MVNDNDLLDSLRYLMANMNPTSYVYTYIKPTYTFPDGTTGSNRPVDGQIFINWNNNLPKDFWKWDDAKGQWLRSNGDPSPDELDLIKEFDRLCSEYDKNCECGSEKAGSNKHSSWCP